MKTLSIMLSMLIAVGMCSADLNASSSRPPTQNTITLIRLNKSITVKRPKSPDLQMITCAYDGKMMELTFTLPEGTSTLTVVDAERQGGVYTFDTSGLEVHIEVGLLSTPIQVQLETGRDNVYEGKFEY